MLSLDPQNPYKSFMVEASAGTGKTYQLTKRFLFLVGAGADPSEILAITFTVKAVGEMHERILSEASFLLVNKEAQEEFDRKLREFYKEFKKSLDEDYSFAPPRSARETAELILASTQRLKITTIDSLFYEWVTRFPAESASEVSDKESFLRSLNLMESYENEALNGKAWDEVLKLGETRDLFDASFKKIDEVLPQKGFLGIQSQVEELYRYRLHIFYLERKNGQPFLPYSLSVGEAFLKRSLKDLVNEVSDHLKELSRHTKKTDELIAFVEEGDFEALVKGRLLTKKGLVSKSLIRGAKRDSLEPQISAVESHFSSFFLEKSKHDLNQVGESLFSIYKAWSSKRDSIKKSLMMCEFSDLSVACHNLFSKESNKSTLWLLQKSIQHVLIDEFQDTSMVQWEVFSNLLEEILSGFESSSDDNSHKTSFVVGDRKQSIYGFREADPFVMNLSSGFFERFGKSLVSLNASYRTSPLIMDLLSDFFSAKIDPSFPRHVTALKPCENPVVPNVSRVVVCENFSLEKGGVLTPRESEAQNLADFFAEVFSAPEKYPVFDKTKKVFRKIRFSDCAVLYRNATHVDTFIEAFEKKNIPARREGDSNFFESPAVKAVVSLLKFFLNQNDLLSLMSFLKAPFFSLDESILLKCLYETRECDPKERLIFLSKKLENLGVDLEFLLTLSQEVTSFLPHKALLSLYERIPAFLSTDSEEERKERKIIQKHLMKLVEVFQDLERKGFLTLLSLLEELEKLSATGLAMSEESTEESVTFMSIHKSKGLEFPLVALIEASDSWFKFDRYWIKSSEGIHYCGTYDTMPHEDGHFKSVYKGSERLMFEESIRLLYVALTRASQYLFVSGHSSSKATASRFHKDLLDFLRDQGVEENAGRFVLEAGLDPLPQVKAFTPRKPIKKESFEVFPFRRGREIKLIAPHESLENKEEVGENSSSKNERLASLLGTFVHKVLELKIQNRNFSFEKLWKNQVENSSTLRSMKMGEAKKKKLYEDMKKECENTFSHKDFQALLQTAEEIECEYSVVALRGSFMIRGVIDLFIKHREGGITLVDFKTSEIPKEESPEGFCVRKGYRDQLFQYEKIVADLYPGSPIQKGVWLTKTASWIPL